MAYNVYVSQSVSATGSLQSGEQRVEGLHRLIAGALLVGRVRDEQRGLIGGGQQNMRHQFHRLVGGQITLFHRALQHRLDGPEAVETFQLAPSPPAQNCGPVQEQDLLDMRGQRGIEESDQAGRKIPRADPSSRVRRLAAAVATSSSSTPMKTASNSACLSAKW